jgi:hypothetical protein
MRNRSSSGLARRPLGIVLKYALATLRWLMTGTKHLLVELARRSPK